MLRKLSFVAVLAGSFLASLGMTETAQATSIYFPPASGGYSCSWEDVHCTNYCVYVFNGHCGRWQAYRTCGSVHEAQRISYQLRANGYNSFFRAI